MKRTRLRYRSNSASAKRRRAKNFGPQAALCRTLPCCCGCGRGPCDPHHEPPRSNHRSKGDCDTVPLFRECHNKRHNTTASNFWEGCGVDPEQIKARLGQEVNNG